MEIDDDEDFDLETPHTSKTQSLGNSGVTITPISHLNKGKQRKETSLGVGVNIHMPSSSLELTKKVKIMPAVTRCVYLQFPNINPIPLVERKDISFTFNHLSKEFLEQMIPHLKAFI